MADGDPMVLQTLSGSVNESLLDNGPLERWSNGIHDLPDGWECTGGYVSVDSDIAISGAPGTYSVVIFDTGMGTGAWGDFRQASTCILNGNDALDARGHKGQSFTASIRHKIAGTAIAFCTLWVYEMDEDDNIVDSHYVDFTPSGSPAQTSQSFTITHNDCIGLWYVVRIIIGVAGYMYLTFDDAELYMSYTFASNPSMPDQQSIFVPNRKFGRDAGGNLYRARGATNAAKFQKQLNFALIGLAQYKALRSLWLLDVPCRWTPNHPHLPSSLDVRLTDDQFNFSLGRGAFGSNIYRGSLELSEI